MLYYSCRYTSYYGIRCNVFGYNSSSSYYRTISYRYTLQHHNITSYPNIIANSTRSMEIVYGPIENMHKFSISVYRRRGRVKYSRVLGQAYLNSVTDRTVLANLGIIKKNRFRRAIGIITYPPLTTTLSAK
ncbi:hypothetical protein SAMN04488494_2071 [Xylanibacter ruminicola]|uniref:Uncharacterized protein n=1 Tax=Xylanibacter ruminicola TaxID=839 RepID=A0A1M7JI83_XYLRU|nr:hypothetical protein SAMN04488493_11445 [Xylanibacter ruminicola]SHM52656.1 hypothetical protein SAMN04488494_2071 [Xylanibacter ruminicola]